MRMTLEGARAAARGGTRSVTEGASECILSALFLPTNALSLTRLRRELPPQGAFLFALVFWVNFFAP